MANFSGDVGNRSHLNYGFGYSYDFTDEIPYEVAKYLGNAAKMMILGDFTAQEDINALGIAGQIGLDIIGIDAAADIRDLVASVRNGDVTGIILNGVGLIPLIGVVQNIKYFDNAKYLDEAADGIRQSDRLDTALDSRKAAKEFDSLDNVDEIVEGTGEAAYDGVRIINKKYAGKVFDLSGDLAKKYPDGVKFTKNGFPDFSPYNIKRVEVDDLVGDTYYDFIKANKAAGFSSTPLGYTWHHVEDGRTLLLVPSDLHSAVRHTGGASLIRKGIAP